MYILFFLLAFLRLNARIFALYLSISASPSTAMAIQWHTTQDDPNNTLFFQTPDGCWWVKTGESVEQDQTFAHKVYLENLTPDTEYSFRIGEIPKIYHFRTAPEDPCKPFNFVIYSKEREFPSTQRTIAKHIRKREADLFAKDDFYYFPPYPPTTAPSKMEEIPYPFQDEDPIRDSCEKTRIAFQRVYEPDGSPDPLSRLALTAASGAEEKMLFHTDKGTDYGGAEKQDIFDSFHRQSVSFVAQAIHALADPDDFSLYATLHAIGLLKLRMAVKTEMSDIFQLGKWRAKAPSTAVYEDDPDQYAIIGAITPMPEKTRYHRYHMLMNSMLSPGIHGVAIRETLEGTVIQLTSLWDGGIEHAPAIHTVKIIDFAEKKIRTILKQGDVPKSSLLKDLAEVHWWLAHLMPFFRGSASCLEILIQALSIVKGFLPPRLAGIPKGDPDRCFLFADLEAMYLPLERFINQYESMIESLE